MNALCSVGVGHIDIGKASFWYVNVHDKLVLLDFPRYTHLSLSTHRRTFTPRQVANRVGCNLNQVAIALNAQQIRDEQVFNVCHHEVVHRGSMVGVPLLCQGGLSLLNLIAVARHIVVVQHLVQQFTMSILRQCVEQVAVAHITRS